MPEEHDAKNANPDQTLSAIFAFFNEVGIIHQLATTLFQSRIPDGVTVAQFSILNHLIRVRDGQTPQVLAQAFQVPKTTMTHSLAGLAKRQFIEFKPHATDGRSKCVWLTPAGRAFRDQSIAALATDMQRLAPQMDVDSLIKITPALSELRQVLDADRD